MTTLESVQTLLCERLARSPHEVLPEARIFDDLGSDSLDLLDILFSLEKRFGIKLRNSELDRLLRGDFNDAERQGQLSAEDVERLCQWLPTLREAPQPITPASLFSHITVASLAQVGEQKRQEGVPDK